MRGRGHLGGTLIRVLAGIVLSVVCAEKGPEVRVRANWRSQTPNIAEDAKSQPSVAHASEAIQKLIREGRYRDADIASRSLLTQVEESSRQDALERAEVLDLLVESLWREGNITTPEGRQLAEQAVAIKEKKLGPTDPGLAKSLLHLAACYSEFGDYAAAKPLFERTLEIQERALGPNHPDIALTLTVFGGSRRSVGDYTEARRLLERGLAIRQTALGPDHLDVAGSLNDLAALVFNTGDRIQARSLMERAVAIWEKNLGPEHPRVGLGLANLAAANASLGDHARASPLFQRALAIQEKTLGPTHPMVALTLLNMASSLQELGQYAAARPLFERSLAIREKVFGPDHPDVASSLLAFGDFLKEIGDYDAAKEVYERAAATLEKALGSENPDLAVSQYHLAVLLGETGAIGLSGETALRAERISAEHIRLTASTLPEREALLYASERPPALDLAITLAAKGIETDSAFRQSVFGALIRSRALVLDTMAARHSAVARTKDPEVSRLASELAAAREDLARLVVRGPGTDPPERYKSLLDHARQEKERAERSLAEKSLAFRNEQARNRASLEDVRAVLPSNSALVAFVRYGSHALTRQKSPGKPPEPVPSYSAFVLRSGESDATLVTLGTVKEIDADVSRWQKQVVQEASAVGRTSQRSEAAYRRTAAELRRKVWDPLAPYFQDTKRVFLVPDGPLHLVNFAALPVGKTRYVIETGPMIHYLSAERDLVPMRTEVENEGLLVVGSPAFDETKLFASLAPGMEQPETEPIRSTTGNTFRGSRSDCGVFKTIRFEPLPSSVQETQEIVALWRNAFRSQPGQIAHVRSATRATSGNFLYLRGAEASEGEFKREATGKRVLHLATHGFFLGGRCASALESPLKGGRGSESAADTGDNPLLLSGLALAGANHRDAAGPNEEDGILTSEEIASLDLSGVEWAVLSACDTGVGEVRAGEGVFGLRRAFQIAGARTLIMSLWPVEDQSTRHWMAALYEARFIKGLDTAQAVHQASLRILYQRRVKNQSTHPFYWAGFVAAGDWR
jgi:CHAT domain-containing protein